jgi:predicted O-methyltransferase YrrM
VNIVLEYIKYRWNAKGRHGTHSPFVYDLTDKCLPIKMDEDSSAKLSKITHDLRKDNRSIKITDFGAGSRKLGNERRISAIFKTSSSKGKYGYLLYRLSKHYKPATILELGTSLGIGSIHFSFGNPSSKIITVEACSATREVACQNFEKYGIISIESRLSTFSAFLENYSGEQFDLVFVDGHHDGDALIHYLEQLDPFTHADTIYILDDIRWSDSMLKAWNKIIAMEEYHVTIDLFRMGMILKRPQQVKEHFVIKL